MTATKDARPACYYCGRIVSRDEIWFWVLGSPSCGTCVELRAIQNYAEPANLTGESWVTGQDPERQFP